MINFYTMEIYVNFLKLTEPKMLITVTILFVHGQKSGFSLIRKYLKKGRLRLSGELSGEFTIGLEHQNPLNTLLAKCYDQWEHIYPIQ